MPLTHSGSFVPTSLKLAILAVGIMLAGCATVPPASDPEARAEFKKLNDPLEPTNRAIQDFNDGVDTVLIKPLAQVYDFILPGFIQSRITAVLRNLDEPLTFANDILQGEPKRAGETLGRFLTNSTVGVAGVFDVASDMGLERHKEDFGQTLAVWGFEEGPYLVLPFLGPSNVRDAIGTGVDFFGDPTSIAFDQFDVRHANLIRTGVGAIDARARNLDTLDELKASSLDYYATLRSAYRQSRHADILNGKPNGEEEDELFEDFEEFEGLDDEYAPPPRADAGENVFKVKF